MPTIEELNARANELLRRFDNITPRGPGWSGNARDGIMFRPPGVAAEEGGGVSGVPIIPPPPIPTGACCDEDGNCTIDTETHCNSLGRDYQGNDVPCSPNPCPTFPPPGTGACCIGDVCSFLNQEDCARAGGIYFGDGSPCTSGICDSAGAICLCPFTPGCHDIGSGVWLFAFNQVLGEVCYYCTCAQDPDCEHIDPCDCLGTNPGDPGWALCATFMELGDAASKLFTPIAGALGMDCVDPQTGNLIPDSPCDKRRQKWNSWGHEMFDELFEDKKPEGD